jgi:hypothetical protein
MSRQIALVVSTIFSYRHSSLISALNKRERKSPGLCEKKVYHHHHQSSSSSSLHQKVNTSSKTRLHFEWLPIDGINTSIKIATIIKKCHKRQGIP